MQSVQSEEQNLFQLWVPEAEPGLQPCGWIPLKAKWSRVMYAPRCPWRCWYSNIVYAASYTRLFFCGCGFAALLPDGISAFLSSSSSLSLSILGPLLSGFGSNQASFICALTRISNVLSYDWLPSLYIHLLLLRQHHLPLCTYSRWMCSPTNRFCIETLSGHLQCVPRQRPAARQGCAPAGRSQWRHRWCPAAWAALHRWFWRPSLSVREISLKYCAEKVERNSVRATVFIKVDFIKVSKVVKNLNTKFANSSSYHLRDQREIMLKLVYWLYLEYIFNVSSSKQKY